MKQIFFILAPIVLCMGCSETNLDELDDDEIAETEKEVEADAQSLEEAADEAVKVLQAEIQTELDNEGVGAVQAAPEPPKPTESKTE